MSQGIEIHLKQQIGAASQIETKVNLGPWDIKGGLAHEIGHAEEGAEKAHRRHGEQFDPAVIHHRVGDRSPSGRQGRVWLFHAFGKAERPRLSGASYCGGKMQGIGRDCNRRDDIRAR
ncbi:hypothetical protein AA0472_0920 [Acetobacter estunensis NRIC 0472]|nr:hypothetical protein AA0472_0920 [Acetobacter estunensis NRIC 0472]